MDVRVSLTRDWVGKHVPLRTMRQACATRFSSRMLVADWLPDASAPP